MNAQSNSIHLKMSINQPSQLKNVKPSERVVTYNGEVDYEKNVINKPTLNGKEISGEMFEDDPSVGSISLSELSNICNSILD